MAPYNYLRLFQKILFKILCRSRMNSLGGDMYKNRSFSMIFSKIIEIFSMLQASLSGIHLLWVKTLQIGLCNTPCLRKISIRLLDAETRICTFYTLRLIDGLIGSIGKIVHNQSSLIESSIQAFSEGIGRSIEVKYLAQCHNWTIRDKPECKLVTRLNLSWQNIHP